MSLIAPTKIEDDTGRRLALCHLTKKTHIIFAGVWRSSIGYVMAPNLCDSDSYYKLTADKLELGKVLGDFPADLPQQPAMSRADMLSGFWGLGVIALLMTLAGFRKAGQARRLTPLPSETDGIPPTAMRAMDAMCHAAKADGKLHPSEITLMADIALQITDEHFDEARIRRMFDAAEAKPTAAQFAAFGTGLTSDQRRMVLRAALMIAAADGSFDHHETAFVYKLARGLNILTDEVAEMLHEMRAKAV
ncbi:MULTISPECIES: DUF533 domain-containing protein [unclassified Ruegeria]|uniref:tellurite resistance TerB family protein n=1 Tax=unclassified Ruegeria TaxID=2625375 RepID=UPI001ADC51C9|nr:MULTISPECIES: DUF533 domain-containing protein [unclassified Ruegeria]MBO9411560.1 TerB family tellurite resistance protein [Ruegeria sp. R8_1]MBO9415878.1 TerB family tellurite resistance protein [Ruegeria sp. R8_2]